MTDTAKPTPGPYKLKVQGLNSSDDDGVEHISKYYHIYGCKNLLIAQCSGTKRIPDDKFYGSTPKDLQEVCENANLVLEAFQTHAETGLTPRQLLDERNALQQRVRELDGLIDRLAPEKEVEVYQNGYCYFCDGEADYGWGGIITIQHKENCAWVEARSALAKHGEVGNDRA